MAAINDNAGIFVGRTLELFNAMQVVVARDGDVSYAQQTMSDEMLKVISTTAAQATSGTGSSTKRRG
jgi:hypothetical protein